MAKTITFNTGTEEVVLSITSIQEMALNDRNLLRVRISEDDHSYDEVKKLRSNVSAIICKEDDVVKSEYLGFTNNAQNGIINNENGIFTVDLTKADANTTNIAKLNDAVEDILLMLMDM